MMLRKRLLVLSKSFDFNPGLEHELIAATSSSTRSKASQAFGFLRDRALVHQRSVDSCLDVLKKKVLKPIVLCRSEFLQPIRDDVDLVIAIGGDGTLLHASHFMDDSVPLLGVNSDPTIPEEVEECIEQYDATRSTGYLCAATVNSFEQILDGILENRAVPSELSRIMVDINSKMIPTYALNDILLAHPCPAAVSRLSFRVTGTEKPHSSLVHSRSSGLRVSTAAGSTAAMLSAGGLPMPILSKDLQYMIREPNFPGPTLPLMHGFIKGDETMDITWSCQDGVLFLDGPNVVHSIHHGDNIRISSRAPRLKMYLPPHLFSTMNEKKHHLEDNR